MGEKGGRLSWEEVDKISDKQGRRKTRGGPSKSCSP